MRSPCYPDYFENQKTTCTLQHTWNSLC